MRDAHTCRLTLQRSQVRVLQGRCRSDRAHLKTLGLDMGTRATSASKVGVRLAVLGLAICKHAADLNLEVLLEGGASKIPNIATSAVPCLTLGRCK